MTLLVWFFLIQEELKSGYCFMLVNMSSAASVLSESRYECRNNLTVAVPRLCSVIQRRQLKPF
jgi:hypothetical protein